MPPTTRLYESGDIGEVGAGPTVDQAAVTLISGAVAPAQGGHVALGPTSDLPNGMFAQVESKETLPDGRTRMVVSPAAISEVLDNVKVDFDEAVTPRLVDEYGSPAADAGPITPGAATIRGGASFSRDTRAAPDDVFECSRSGSPLSAEDAWDSSNPFPIELRVQNTRLS